MSIDLIDLMIYIILRFLIPDIYTWQILLHLQFIYTLNTINTKPLVKSIIEQYAATWLKNFSMVLMQDY